MVSHNITDWAQDADEDESEEEGGREEEEASTNLPEKEEEEEEEAPPKKREPFVVPTAGAFWLHDDRFDEEEAK